MFLSRCGLWHIEIITVWRNELLLSDVVKLENVYNCLANATLNQEIVLDDVLVNDWGVIQEGTIEKGYYGMISASDVAIWLSLIHI